MPLYNIFFIIILCGALVEAAQKKKSKVFFYVVYILISVAVCFRYGQGADYFGYEYIYDTVPSIRRQGFEVFWSSPRIGQVGWRLMVSVFKSFGISYQMMTIIVSAFEMIMLLRFINRFCEYKFWALLLSYHTFIMVYVLSVQREGVMICAFLGILLPWFVEKKYYRYIIGVVILSTIHKVAPIYLGLLLFAWIKPLRVRKNQNIIICFMWIMGTTIGIVKGMNPPIAAIERLVLFTIVQILCKRYKRYRYIKQDDRNVSVLMNCYAYSMMLYGLLQSEFLISASRTGIVTKIVEIGLVSYYLYHTVEEKKKIYFCIIIIVSMMYIKNLYISLQSENYNPKYRVWNYPYISIFSSGEILDYKERSYTHYYGEE